MEVLVGKRGEERLGLLCFGVLGCCCVPYLIPACSACKEWWGFDVRCGIKLHAMYDVICALGEAGSVVGIAGWGGGRGRVVGDVGWWCALPVGHNASRDPDIYRLLWECPLSRRDWCITVVPRIWG